MRSFIRARNPREESVRLTCAIIIGWCTIIIYCLAILCKTRGSISQLVWLLDARRARNCLQTCVIVLLDRANFFWTRAYFPGPRLNLFWLDACVITLLRMISSVRDFPLRARGFSSAHQKLFLKCDFINFSRASEVVSNISHTSSFLCIKFRSNISCIKFLT